MEDILTNQRCCGSHHNHYLHSRFSTLLSSDLRDSYFCPRDCFHLIYRLISINGRSRCSTISYITLPRENVIQAIQFRYCETFICKEYVVRFLFDSALYIHRTGLQMQCTCVTFYSFKVSNTSKGNAIEMVWCPFNDGITPDTYMYIQAYHM